MKHSRRWPRYSVDPAFSVIATIPQSSTKSFKIQSLSLGGCGLYTSCKDARLLKLPKIDLQFQFDSRIVEMVGSVQYCTLRPKVRQDPTYLGIQFEKLESGLLYVLKTWFDEALSEGKLIEEPLA